MFWTTSRKLRQIKRELRQMSAKLDKLIEKITNMDSVADAVREERDTYKAALEDAKAQLEEHEGDTAKIDMALELAQRMIDENSQPIVENTDGTFTPSGN